MPSAVAVDPPSLKQTRSPEPLHPPNKRPHHQARIDTLTSLPSAEGQAHINAGTHSPQLATPLDDASLSPRSSKSTSISEQILGMHLDEAVNEAGSCFFHKRILELRKWQDGRTCNIIRWYFQPKEVVEEGKAVEEDEGEPFPENRYGSTVLLTKEWFEEELGLLLE